MESIANIKNSFNNVDIFKIFSDCMYMPTQEKLIKRADEYMNNDSINIFGFFDNQYIIGVIVVEQIQDVLFEIKGIAVDSKYRRQGIGKQLVQFVCEELSITELYAETDDDSVEFYKNCGFAIQKFQRKIKNGEYTRYKCILYKK